MDILNLKTQEEQQEFFKACFSKFSDQRAADVAENAKLIFARASECWSSKKIVIEYKGKRRYYPAGAEIGRALAAAADTLMFEILLGGKF